MLIFAPNSANSIRIGVAAGRSLGNAVERNRAKRRLKACIHSWIPYIKPGLDIILLARKPILTSSFAQLQSAVNDTLTKSKIINDDKSNS